MAQKLSLVWLEEIHSDPTLSDSGHFLVVSDHCPLLEVPGRQVWLFLELKVPTDLGYLPTAVSSVEVGETG